jgi:hypothetical protein
MDFEEIKSKLVATAKHVLDLQNACATDATDSIRFEFKALAEKRTNAFLRLLNDYPPEQYLEVCRAMEKARAE